MPKVEARRRRGAGWTSRTTTRCWASAPRMLAGGDPEGVPQAGAQAPPGRQQGSGAEARFKEVAEAYEVLKDPEKRAEVRPVRAAPGSSAGRAARRRPAGSRDLRAGSAASSRLRRRAAAASAASRAQRLLRLLRDALRPAVAPRRRRRDGGGRRRLGLRRPRRLGAPAARNQEVVASSSRSRRRAPAGCASSPSPTRTNGEPRPYQGQPAARHAARDRPIRVAGKGERGQRRRAAGRPLPQGRAPPPPALPARRAATCSPASKSRPGRRRSAATAEIRTLDGRCASAFPPGPRPAGASGCKGRGYPAGAKGGQTGRPLRGDPRSSSRSSSTDNEQRALRGAAQRLDLSIPEERS